MISLKCPNCKTKGNFKIINDPNCDCPDKANNGIAGGAGIAESAYLPCTHQPHGQCISCKFIVGTWNSFVMQQFARRKTPKSVDDLKCPVCHDDLPIIHVYDTQKDKTEYVCQDCNAQFAIWWGLMNEEGP